MPDVLIPIPIETVTDSEEQPSLTYRLDLDAGRIVGKVDNLEAVNQASEKPSSRRASSASSTTTSMVAR